MFGYTADPCLYLLWAAKILFSTLVTPEYRKMTVDTFLRPSAGCVSWSLHTVLRVLYKMPRFDLKKSELKSYSIANIRGRIGPLWVVDTRS